MVTHINNEAANQVALFGTEVIAGQAVPPTARLNGTFEASAARGAVRRREEATGGYDRLRNPSRERGTPSGTYGADLTFQEWAALLRYAIKSGDAGQEIVPGAYRHRKVPSFSRDDIESMTVVTGIEGKGYQSTGVRFDEFTLTVDATDQDNAWKWSSNLFLKDKERLPGAYTGIATAGTTNGLTVEGAGWTIDQWEGAFVYIDYGSHIGDVRMVDTNTATGLVFDQPLSAPVTAGTVFHIAMPLPVVPEIEGEPITVEGTQLLLGRYNPSSPFTGLEDVSERMVSFSLTTELNLSPKIRFPGRIGRVGRGARWFAGTIQLEDDRWDEEEAWEKDKFLSIRILKDGPEIGDTGENFLAGVDLEKVIFSTITPDSVENNMTKSIAFLGVKPFAGDIAAFDAVNDLEFLP